jgi:dTDP-4-dehydrorhamnose reductase
VAYNAVDKAEEEPDIANNINGYAVGNLAKVCKAVGAKLVHFSSNYVFDGTNQNGYNESEIPSPQSAYGRSKLLGEVQIQQHSDNYYIIRSTWLYGTPGLSESSKKNYVETILELVPQKEYIECVDDQYGQPTYTHDLATATKTLIEQDLPAGIYHLTNSGSATWFTWAEEIFRLKQIAIQLHHNSMANFNRAAHRPQYGILNNSKFPVLRPWQKALADYLTSN